ncbi:hypothetical protein [Kitasatospora sp. NPDC086791]|uniref:hypothetical protein n=1 Tax=Kitasatospora sp. NPDC086791 TaxID=3155178 RepID=UPI003444A14F
MDLARPHGTGDRTTHGTGDRTTHGTGDRAAPPDAPRAETDERAAGRFGKSPANPRFPHAE